jgi:adenylate kinase
MNLFLGGIHGVGKTYLSDLLPADIELRHVTASSMIKEECPSINCDTKKQVTDDLKENQIGPPRAVRRLNDTGIRLILDGHFVLLDARGGFFHVKLEVFESLSLDGAILIEAEPRAVAARILERDRVIRDEEWLATFMTEERRHGQAVCKALNIPLEILQSPQLDKFAVIVRKMYKTWVAYQ